MEELTERWAFIASALGLLAILQMVAWRTKSDFAALVAFTALPLLLMIAGFGPWVREAERRSARSLAMEVDSRAVGAEVVCLRCYPTSLPFYLGQSVPLVSRNARELTSNYLLAEPGRALGDQLVPPEALPGLMAGESPPFVLTSRWEAERLTRLSPRPLEPFYIDRASVLFRPKG